MAEWNIKLFGPMAQAAGGREIAVRCDDPHPTCVRLRGLLAEAAPAIAPMIQSARLAVNHRFAADDETVQPGDELALIGMVSGG